MLGKGNSECKSAEVAGMPLRQEAYALYLNKAENLKIEIKKKHIQYHYPHLTSEAAEAWVK